MLSFSEIDGIPAVIAKSSGPLTAGLFFRVGRADETLATAGITHLTEHLALHRFGLETYHANGVTGPDHTCFQSRGSEDDIRAFLNGVCVALSDLPMDRLETEKSILRTEETGRSITSQLHRHRYGARGYGLLDYPELGVQRLRFEEVRQWAQTWFTQQNAVLWIAGDRVPPNLRLPLLEGTRRPITGRDPILRSTPAYFSAGSGQVIFSSVVADTPAAKIFAKVLERELFRNLRQRGGYAYTAVTSYAVRGDGLAEITALTDALPEKQDALLGGVIDVLAQLRVGRIDQRDIQAARGQIESCLHGQDSEASRLLDHAANILSGQSYHSSEQTLAQLRMVGVREVQAVATAAANSVLMRLPRGTSADWAGFTPVPRHSASDVPGTRFSSVSESKAPLVIGNDGCGLLTSDGPLSVRFNECAAMLSWPDGGRSLIGNDGITVSVEPTLFKGIDSTVLEKIDAGVGRDKIVTLPARPPEEIPQPVKASARSSTKNSEAAATPMPAKRAARVLLITAMVFGVFAALTTAGLLIEHDSGADGWVGAGALWAVCGLFLWASAKRRKQARYQ